MDTTELSVTPTDTGLTAAQVAERRSRGLVNELAGAASRSFGDIVRTNVFTRFNFLLGGLLAVIIFVAPLQDALFGLVLVANTLIGIIQEFRAKRTLDRLAVISAPHARVVRDGRTREILVGDVVLDDVVVLALGDQIVVDGRVLVAHDLEINESLVTGESDPIVKDAGDGVLSGSFVVAGTGRILATRVGRDSHAGRLTEEARRFSLAHSELRNGINRILKVITWVLVPVALLLVITQLRHAETIPEALAGSVAGTIGMVPEGLVLLTSVAFAVAVIRLGRRNVLVQELPAVETLARVDVVCFDKTGTITTGSIRVHKVQATPQAVGAEAALGALAAADPDPNTTLRAIKERFPEPEGWTMTGSVPFSSARRWSAAAFDGRGSWVLGAPEVFASVAVAGEEIDRSARAATRAGRRVVLLAQTDAALAGRRLPPDLTIAAVVVLGEEIRRDAADTVGYFQAQGVRTLVISGDHPQTVAAIAGRVGIPVSEGTVAAQELPEDRMALAGLLDRNTVFGRVGPEQKRQLIQALHAGGHVVAMTGDGVNDVLALKDADIGIAMGKGAPATRAVSQLVLLDGRFATLPEVVAEGRRVIANIERVAKLFLTKTVYAALMALAIGVAELPFPFLPRHLTLVSSLTIGIPSFFLALEPGARRAGPGFVRRVLGFAVPAGLVAATATFGSYWLAHDGADLPLGESRTAATVTLFGVGLLVLRVLSRPLNALRRSLLAGAGIAFGLTLALPGTRVFFALEPPPLIVLLMTIGIVALAGIVIELAARAVDAVQRVVSSDATLPSIARAQVETVWRRVRRLVRSRKGRRPGGPP